MYFIVTRQTSFIMKNQRVIISVQKMDIIKTTKKTKCAVFSSFFSSEFFDAKNWNDKNLKFSTEQKGFRKISRWRRNFFLRQSCSDLIVVCIWVIWDLKNFYKRIVLLLFLKCNIRWFSIRSHVNLRLGSQMNRL